MPWNILKNLIRRWCTLRFHSTVTPSLFFLYRIGLRDILLSPNPTPSQFVPRLTEMFLFLTKILRHQLTWSKKEGYIYSKLLISDINLTLTSSGISDRWTNFLNLLEITIDSVLDVLRKQAIFRPVNIFQDLCLVELLRLKGFIYIYKNWDIIGKQFNTTINMNHSAFYVNRETKLT